MEGKVWDPNKLREPLVVGEVTIVEWTHAPEGAPRRRAVLQTEGMPEKDLAQYKGRELFLTLEDGRQARVQVQYVATLPKGTISTLRILGEWEDNLVPEARQAA